MATNEVQVVIPSLNRAELARECANLFERPLVCVEERQYERYREQFEESALLPCPDTVQRLVGKRDWILRNVEAPFVFMCDDDVRKVWSLVDHKRVLHDPKDVQRVLENTARNMREAGTVAFSFAHTPNPTDCYEQHFISLTGHLAGSAFGFYRVPFLEQYQFDHQIESKIDIDISCQILYRHRFLWRDTRFCFETRPFMGVEGGFCGIRTQHMLDKDIEVLKRKYGEAITVNHTESKKGVRQIHVRVKVKR